MLASILISVVSVVLLGYWFRYSCLLLLRTRTEQAPAASDHRFSFGTVRDRLETAPDLDPLQQSLDRDYRILAYLLQHKVGPGAQSVEDRLLMLDYRLMQRWYSLTRTAAPTQARRALAEMTSVVACLAQKMAAPSGVESEV